MKNILSITALILTTYLNGQDQSFYKKLALLEYNIDFKGDKYGILKDSALTDYKYDTIIYPGQKKYYLARIDSLWGVIDLNDQVILPFDYQMIELTAYNNSTGNDTFIVQKDGLFGTVDFSNHFVIPPIYEAISGWCEFGPEAHYVRKNGKIGLIKHEGEVLVPLIYDSLHFYGPRLIKAKLGLNFGVIDITNQVVVPFQYQELIVDFDFMGLESSTHRDKFVVLIEGEWNYLDPSGNILESKVDETEIKRKFANFQLTNYDLSYTELCLIKEIKTTANNKK